MMPEDPAILHSMLEDRDRRIADLENQLHIARASAIRWEQEAKSYRTQVQRLRQDADTERLVRK